MLHKLITEFNEVLKEKGYTSRIKGLQDAMNEYINKLKSHKITEKENML
ncbi:hypothetical protein [uncultured Methanobacterium sp.]|nr:hypothetical protein [uncultured Methanobacterium sp.]